MGTAAPIALPDGIVLRWKASDLSSSPVSIWTDEIQGYNWIQTTNAVQPTWDTNGVHFTGGQFLIATNMSDYGPDGAKACGWLVVMEFDNTAEIGQIILGNRFSGGQMFVAIGSTANYFYEGTTGNNAVGALPVLQTFDFLICKSNLVNGGLAYTNGLQAWSSPGGNWTYGSAFTQVGCSDTAPTDDFKGTLKEIIVWTNAVWTSLSVSNIHKYATNQYGFSP